MSELHYKLWVSGIQYKHCPVSFQQEYRMSPCMVLSPLPAWAPPCRLTPQTRLNGAMAWV